MLKTQVFVSLLSFTIAIAGCSPANNTSDSSVTDTGVVANDSPSPTVDTPNVERDVATTVDTPSVGNCGAMTCGMGEVCCAAQGPADPMRCRPAAMCATVICQTQMDCTAGTACCTDGIQQTCSPNDRCPMRACATSADCLDNAMCCPFANGTKVCRPNC